MCDDLAIVLACFNFSRSPLRRLRFLEALGRWRNLTPHVYGMEASLDGTFDFAGEPDVRCFTVKSCVWMQESLINKAIKALPKTFTKVAWIDPDVEVVPDKYESIVDATSACLDHVDVVQIGSKFQLLDEYDNVSSTSVPMVYLTKTNNGVGGGAPGFCWAARRDSLERINYLPEMTIVGGGDRIFWLGLLQGGHWTPPVPEGHPELAPSAEYVEDVTAYLTHAQNAKLTYDYVPGVVRHYWHGPYSHRRYREKYQMLRAYRRDEITKDENGLTVVNNPRLEEKLKNYFAYLTGDVEECSFV